MSEKVKHVPDRILSKLKNDYDRPFPEGSIKEADLIRGLQAHYSQGRDDARAKALASSLVNRLHKAYSFYGFGIVIKNPDSVKNRSVERFLTKDTVEDLLSLKIFQEKPLCFKNQGQLDIIQEILRSLVVPRED